MVSDGQTFDVEVCDGRRWILLTSCPTLGRAMEIAKEGNGTTRRARVRADRWDEARQVYIGKIVYEYEPGSAASYKDKYLKR